MAEDRNNDIAVEKMIEYLKGIQDMIQGNDTGSSSSRVCYDSFIADSMRFKAVCFDIIQLAELYDRLKIFAYLGDEGYDEKWHRLSDIQRYLLYAFYNLNKEELWKMVTEDLPRIQEFCEKYLERSRLEQDFLRVIVQSGLTGTTHEFDESCDQARAAM